MGEADPCLRLKWSRVDLGKKTLTFNEQKKRKKERLRFLNDDMVDLLLQIKQHNLLKGIEPEYIFLGPEGKKKPAKPVKCIRRAFKTALKEAGIKDFHSHDLRHPSASHLIMRGASLKTVQEHLNHSSPTMTNRYAHLSDQFQREQIEKLNGLCDEPTSKKIVRSEVLNENEQQQTYRATA